MGNSTNKENKKMPAKRQSAPAAKAKPPAKAKRAWKLTSKAEISTSLVGVNPISWIDLEANFESLPKHLMDHC